MDKKLLWVWLSLLFGADKAIYKKIYENFDIEEAYDFDDNSFSINDELFSEYEIRNLLDKNLKEAKKVVEWCEKAQVEIITIESDNYPKRLLSLANCPGVLYCRGKLPDIDNELCVTVIGTRKQTTYGAKVAFELGYGLTKGGALVISGGAIGNDTSSHKGALYSGGKTVVVLGSGINVIYPRENANLFELVAANGAIITEYPPSTPPNGHNFPKRNRIMAALSNATIVVEGGERSGTSITADIAKRLGKTLFAVPGPVDAPYSFTPNELIKNGALSATSAIDVLEQFLDEYSGKIDLTASKQRPNYDHGFEVFEEKQTSNFISKLFGKSKEDKKQNKVSKAEQQEKTSSIDTSKLSLEEKKIYDFMVPDKEYDLDMLDALDFDFTELTLYLLNMQMTGYLTEVPGGRYKKNI